MWLASRQLKMCPISGYGSPKKSVPHSMHTPDIRPNVSTYFYHVPCVGQFDWILSSGFLSLTFTLVFTINATPLMRKINLRNISKPNKYIKSVGVDYNYVPRRKKFEIAAQHLRHSLLKVLNYSYGKCLKSNRIMNQNRITYGVNCVLFRGSQVGNNLPPQIECSISIDKFKV